MEVWELRCLDVEHACLPGDIGENICAEPPKFTENSLSCSIAEKSHVPIVSVGLTLIPKIYHLRRQLGAILRRFIYDQEIHLGTIQFGVVVDVDHILLLTPGMETLTTKKKPYNDHPKFNFPGDKSPPPKFSHILRTLYSPNIILCTAFLYTGHELVRSARRLHTQRHILQNTWVTLLYISVGREKS